MKITYHANQRMQQRAIPYLAIDLLQIYGCTEYSSGDRIRYFDKNSRQRMSRALEELTRDLDKIGDMYCVESKEGTVITAGHRTRQIKQKFKQKKHK